MKNPIKTEPVALAAVFIAAVTVITSFVSVTDNQQSALILFATALGAVFARQSVTPVN